MHAAASGPVCCRDRDAQCGGVCTHEVPSEGAGHGPPWIPRRKPLLSGPAAAYTGKSLIKNCSSKASSSNACWESKEGKAIDICRMHKSCLPGLCLKSPYTRCLRNSNVWSAIQFANVYAVRHRLTSLEDQEMIGNPVFNNTTHTCCLTVSNPVCPCISLEFSWKSLQH